MELIAAMDEGRIISRSSLCKSQLPKTPRRQNHVIKGRTRATEIHIKNFEEIPISSRRIR